MKRLMSTWWFRIPFIYWLAGILIYPPVFDRPPDSGFIRSRMWMTDFIGDDWNSIALFDWGTVAYQFCLLTCLAVILRFIGDPLIHRIRNRRVEQGSR